MKMDLSSCTLCPRNCRVDRKLNKGVCAVSGEDVLVSRAALHYWEEPCISGKRGSGTVFFVGCNLHCLYCQNREISSGQGGKVLRTDELSEVFLNLQAQGAHNINLVTPTHYALQIREALLRAKENGLDIPVVYNCGGYEKPETLKELQGLIDVYLTDFKYMDPALARTLSSAEDYPERVKEALSEMVRQQPVCVFDADDLMVKGVIVRHLLLPGHVKEAKSVCTYLYDTYKDRIFLSLMNQYTPMRHFEAYPSLNRKVTKREYERLLSFVLDLGVENAFFQEGETAEESFIPPFDLTGL